MSRRTSTLLACTTLAIAFGCASPTEAPYDRDPTIDGLIVALDVEADSFDEGEPTVHVKEEVDDECGIIFGLDASTEITRRDAGGDDRIPASIEDLDTGDAVRVWARGGIADSCPQQGFAEAIEIVVDIDNETSRAAPNLVPKRRTDT
ncbi:MAG: DUF3221 domain-containing protein [Gemmatimonadota bacterium]